MQNHKIDPVTFPELNIGPKENLSGISKNVHLNQ